MIFSIIIPAYNEEQSIGSVIERTLQARSRIIQSTPVKEVEIVVINDGSDDKTKEIVQGFKEVCLISYEKNKGYGAAIKRGFETARGHVLGFMDADGTCDPEFFSVLINALHAEKADIALGSRLGPHSKMPTVRRIGNTIYAKIINFMGNVKITDAASGMRVLTKNSLIKLYPLPDGMHFTPAMSCKALMHKDLRIIEEPMAYSEREGESKLSVIKDGMRFFKIIMEIALYYRPLKFLITIGSVLIVLGLVYSISPIVYYLVHRRLEEWFIYRLISIVVFFVAGMNLIMLGFVADELAALMHHERSISEKINSRLIRRMLYPRNILKLGLLISLSGILLNSKVIYQYLTTGHIYIHWVYILTGALLVLTGVQLFTFGILQKILVMYKIHQDYHKTPTV